MLTSLLTHHKEAGHLRIRQRDTSSLFWTNLFIKLCLGYHVVRSRWQRNREMCQGITVCSDNSRGKDPATTSRSTI